VIGGKQRDLSAMTTTGAAGSADDKTFDGALVPRRGLPRLEPRILQFRIWG
jgi:hypothetical protein